MEAMELIKGRRSVRRYKEEIVPKNVMKNIIEGARYAPSWGNTQIARYTLVTDTTVIEQLAEKCVKGFVYNVKALKKAKNVAVLSYVQGKSGVFDADKAKLVNLQEGEYVTDKGATWEEFDAGIACQTFCLSAYAQGVGTCVMGVIEPATIADVISLPEDETVAALIIYGYPDEEPKPTPRHDVDDITRYII